ncbi:MAG: GNAT family N-acetyltransferase [Taibaiella sp.]|nr:GNAT family N-acetyltransferase [Taibaiella sp.]
MNNQRLYRQICSEEYIPIFLQPWWLDAVCKEWDAAIVQQGEHVTGIWPYAIEKRLGLPILRNPKLTPYLGPHIIVPDDMKLSKADGIEQEIVGKLLQQMPQAKVWNIALQPGMKQAGVMKRNELEVQVQQTFLLDITREENTILAGMSESIRRNIRTGGKEIVVTNEPDFLPHLYRFQKKALAKKGIRQHFTLQDAQKLMNACLDNFSTALWVAKHKGLVQAAIWNVWDHERSYYFMGAQKEDNKDPRIVTVILLHAIMESKHRGNLTFDFEGSMDEGVEKYFRGFGGTRELYMIIKKNTSMRWNLKEMIRP